MTAPDFERKETIKRSISTLAEDALVSVTFTPGRRATDIFMVLLSGRKEVVLEIPMKILDVLDQEDLEIIRSTEGQGYQLTIVITQKLQQQPTQVPERRAKLRNLLDRELSEL